MLVCAHLLIEVLSNYILCLSLSCTPPRCSAFSAVVVGFQNCCCDLVFSLMTGLLSKPHGWCSWGISAWSLVLVPLLPTSPHAVGCTESGDPSTHYFFRQSTILRTCLFYLKGPQNRVTKTLMGQTLVKNFFNIFALNRGTGVDYGYHQCVSVFISVLCFPLSKEETAQLLCVTSASASSPVQHRSASWSSEVTFCVLACAHCLWSWHWTSLEIAWPCVLFTLLSGIYLHW